MSAPTEVNWLSVALDNDLEAGLRRSILIQVLQLRAEDDASGSVVLNTFCFIDCAGVISVFQKNTSCFAPPSKYVSI